MRVRTREHEANKATPHACSWNPLPVIRAVRDVQKHHSSSLCRRRLCGSPITERTNYVDESIIAECQDGRIYGTSVALDEEGRPCTDLRRPGGSAVLLLQPSPERRGNHLRIRKSPTERQDRARGNPVMFRHAQSAVKMK